MTTDPDVKKLAERIKIAMLEYGTDTIEALLTDFAASVRAEMLETATRIVMKPRIMDSMTGHISQTSFAEDIVSELERALASPKPEDQ